MMVLCIVLPEPELVLEVDVGGGDERMYPRPPGALERPPGRVYVVGARPG